MDNPDFSGNAFSQGQTFYNIWIMIYLYKYLITNSSMTDIEQRVFSFIRRIFISIYTTYSCAVVVLTSINPTLSYTFLNYVSIRTMRVTNPFLAYNFTILIRDLVNYPDVQVGTYLQAINMIFRKKVTKNVIPFTNMTSTVRVKKLCS